MSAPAPPILTASLRQHSTYLTLTVKIRNSSASDFGLFARIPETFADGSLKLAADTVYVELIDGCLRVEKSAIEVPKELKVAVRSVPFAMKLPSGVEWTEEIRLPLPVRVCHPYRRAMLAGANPGSDVNPDDPKSAKELEVIYGAFPIDSEVKMTSVSAAFPEVFRVWPPGPAMAGQVRVSRRIALSPAVLVLDYGVVPPIV